MDYRLAQRTGGARGSIIRELLKLANQPGMISFGGGSPDPAAFPSQEVARITQDAMTHQAKTMLQYGVSEGYAPLVNSLKAYLTKQESFDFTKNELIILSGGQQAADLTGKLFVNEGDSILVENPSFIGCMNAFRSYGGQLKGIPLQEDGPDLLSLEAAVKQPYVSFFYTIPTFQNPSGLTTSLKKRKTIYEMACKHNLLLFEDNPYGELRFAGEPVPSYKSMDRENRVIYAGSFSKTLAPGLRVGYLVCPKPLFVQYKIAKQASDVHSSTLYQHVCHVLLTQWDYASHVKRVSKLYHEKSQLMFSMMKQCFHPFIRFQEPEGGLFIMAIFPKGFDTLPFAEEAVKRGVIAVPGNAFTSDPDKPNHTLRLNFSMPSREQIEKGIPILGSLSHEMLDHWKAPPDNE